MDTHIRRHRTNSVLDWELRRTEMKDLIKTTEAKSKSNLDTITSESTSFKSKLIAIVKQMILVFSKK